MGIHLKKVLFAFMVVKWKLLLMMRVSIIVVFNKGGEGVKGVDSMFFSSSCCSYHVFFLEMQQEG